MFHDRKRSTCLSQWDEFIVLNIVQTLSLFLQSNYDRSWPSFLLIIIVDFYDQKASILLGYNQRNYITSRTNSEQHLLFFVRITCTAWKVSKYGVFFYPYFPVYGAAKTPYLHIFHGVMNWNRIVIFHEYFKCKLQFGWPSDTVWNVSFLFLIFLHSIQI